MSSRRIVAGRDVDCVAVRSDQLWRPACLLAAVTLASGVIASGALGVQPMPDPTPRAAALARLPQVMLWAWERPEDLRFVDPRTTGVCGGTIW